MTENSHLAVDEFKEQVNTNCGRTGMRTSMHAVVSKLKNMKTPIFLILLDIVMRNLHDLSKMNS